MIEKEEGLEIHGFFCLVVNDNMMLFVPVKPCLRVAAMREAVLVSWFFVSKHWCKVPIDHSSSLTESGESGTSLRGKLFFTMLHS